MKKILFLCDGNNFSKGAFEFIKLLNEDEPVFVKGIFFSPIDFQQLIAVSYIPTAVPYQRLKDEEDEEVRQSREKFIHACEVNNIKYHINDIEEWDRALLVKETRFADVAVISEELFCSEVSVYQPNAYMREVLHGAECPALVIPENFRSIERLVVAYDGKKESMQALKQFCSLFPQFTELPAEFVYVKDEAGEDIPDKDLLQEYMMFHFSSSGLSKLHFDANKYFAAWAEVKKNILLVAGAFSRSAISDMLHKSFADDVIHDHKIPVFIAHHA